MKNKSYVITILVLILFIAISWIATIYYVPKFYGKPDSAGTFGDMFGSLNTLFSGLAFVGVIVAILLQRKELELQRQELEDTREELKGQKDQLIEQNKTLRKQSFENTFFQFLKLYNDIVNSVDIDENAGTFASLLRGDRNSKEKPPATGRDGFVKLYYRFSRRALNSIESKAKEKAEIVVKNIITEEYDKFYRENQSDLGHYYRTIYTQ